ncbi:hypothetical protein MBLNU459_g2990t2 [Dothideomycetes sp. NU459]
MADRGKRTMEKKNVSFSKDGMKVGVKEIKDEDYTDKTQSYFVKAWNYSSFPAYKSRLWNTEAQGSSSSSSSRPSSAARSTQIEFPKITTHVSKSQLEHISFECSPGDKNESETGQPWRMA